jgi:hypothetical protein
MGGESETKTRAVTDGRVGRPREHSVSVTVLPTLYRHVMFCGEVVGWEGWWCGCLAK